MQPDNNPQLAGEPPTNNIPPSEPTVITSQVSPAKPVTATGNTSAVPNVPTPTPASEVPIAQQISQGDVRAGFSQSDALAHEKKIRRKKRLIIVGGVLTGLTVLLVVFMIVMGSLYGLKTITYENGDGAKFNMKFYKKYHLADAQLKDKHSSKLVSEVSVAGKAPVAMYIDGGQKTVSDNEWQKSPNRDCSGNAPKAFSVHNSNIDQDINICLVPEKGNDDVLYVGAFRYNTKIYVIVINQDLNLSGLSGGRNDPTAQKAAQDLLPRVGLQVYKNDLTKILQSVKVVN